MEAVDEWWLFAVFMGVVVLILIIKLIRELWSRKNKPTNPQDKELRRELRKDLTYFFLKSFGGGKNKYEDDNPMNPKEEDDKYI